MIERHGVAFRHTDEADFEKELAFDRRVSDYARPQVACLSAHTWTDVRSSEAALRYAVERKRAPGGRSFQTVAQMFLRESSSRKPMLFPPFARGECVNTRLWRVPYLDVRNFRGAKRKP